MYMRVLMKETLTLHKVLSKYLATQAVEVSYFILHSIALVFPAAVGVARSSSFQD